VLPQHGPPALLPDAVVTEIRTGLEARRDGARTRGLQRGDRVTIVSGPLRWHDALFERRLNAAGRVRVLLDLIQRTVAVDIEESVLKRVS
jgi:transcription antitermination factor NusG